MVDEAEKNAVADTEKSEQIDLKNQSDSLCYQTKKQLSDLESKISVEEKGKIEETVDKLEKASQSEDYESMKTLNEELKAIMMEIGQKVYTDPQNDTTGNNDEVIETDFSAEK